MKTIIKRRFRNKLTSLAVAAACVGGLGFQSTAMAGTDANALGDLALVPYYTVRGNFVTGVHIINTGPHTQVVKFRMRRAEDSADALDVLLVMSPYDEWTGFISGSETDGITLGSDDKTCTAPAADANGKWKMPDINLTGAEEGYIEVIAMGQTTDETQAIAVAAKHDSNGVPKNCDEVRENFFARALPLPGGVISNQETKNFAEVSSTYVDSANDLKVSYFIRDPQSGMEFGNNAVHIKDFVPVSGAAMITNQETGLSSGDAAGFDFPDLDGGGKNTGAGDPATGPANRGLYDAVVRLDLGGAAILNDYSKNQSNGVTTDWVVTIPGQYLMVNPNPPSPAINERDLPVTATVEVWDREEKKYSSRNLVISPDAGRGKTTLPWEVNIVRWGDKSIFETPNARTISGFDAPYGWAKLTLASQTDNPQQIYNLTDPTGGTKAAPNNPVPVIGYAAWRRTFNNAEKNYGRIIEHSRIPQ